jgi:hypothetical protein
MQRIVDDHTKYMVRARPKCKMDGEIFGHRSANNSGRLYEPLYEYLNGITKDGEIIHYPVFIHNK